MMRCHMRRKMIIWFIILISPVFLNAQNILTGEMIVKKMHSTNQSKIGLVIKGEAEIINLKTKEKEKREFLSLSLLHKSMKRLLFRFMDSSYIGTTLLSIERPNKKILQYIYHKSDDLIKQVEDTEKENNFCNMDFSFEDIGVEDMNDYTYKRLKDKKIKGKDCFMVERYPKNNESIYSKHVAVIDKTSFILIAMKSFNKAGKVVRMIKREDIRKNAGNVFIPYQSIVTDIKDKKRTVLKVIEVKQNDKIRRYFNKNRIKEKWSVD